MAIEFDQTISLGDLLQTAGIGIALGTFYFQNKSQISAQRLDVYQKLEIESNEIFKFEAEHRDDILAFKRRVAPASIAAEYAAGTCENNSVGHKYMLARKYYENCCNIFEVSARLRRADIVPHEVFGSWVAWYFDTVCEWGFRATWNDLRDNYTSEMRTIFDPFVERLIKSWDVPAAEALDKNGTFEIDASDLEKLRRDFYRHVGKYFGCRVILKWIDAVGDDLYPPHPFAYR